MFTETSMTGTGMIITVLVFGAQWLGINFDQSTATVFVKDAVEVIGIVLAVWGQLRRKDLSMGLFRK